MVRMIPLPREVFPHEADRKAKGVATEDESWIIEPIVSVGETRCLDGNVMCFTLPVNLVEGQRYLIQISLNDGVEFSPPSRTCTYNVDSAGTYLHQDGMWSDSRELRGSQHAFRKYQYLQVFAKA